MKKSAITFLALFILNNTYAATQQMLWGDAERLMPKTKPQPPLMKPTQFQVIPPAPITPQNNYQLQLINTSYSKNKHLRYQITYKGIPVWGQQLIFHEHAKAKPTVTGINITGIEKDITSVVGKLSEVTAENKILVGIDEPVKHKTNTKVIFIDPQNKAHLAYHLVLYIHKSDTLLDTPNYLIDANTGAILKQWNGTHHEKIGQGMGGNTLTLPYRSGTFQYGNALSGLPSLDKFDVEETAGECQVQNNSIRVITLLDIPLNEENFPITVFDEEKHGLKAFSYPCSPTSQYVHYSDGMDGPIHYAYSSINDTMYFAQKTLDMYAKSYGVEKPLGDDLPIRAYTHLNGMDNAFAIPTIRENGLLLAHQQIVIGDGESYFSAPTQSVVSHELSHNFTEINSGLLYEGQTGGINEAFSDMAAIALQDYLRKEHPWYWDGEDWTIGRESTLNGMPLRYMDDPTQDGESIGNAQDYRDDLDVHNTSGVFNKAFYLLAHKPGWSIQQAFQVMVDANQHYWSPIAYYDFAACGVIQAAIDRELDEKPVIEAFAEVGVICPVHKT